MFDDQRIDEAARALTQGEPRRGFRARVLARLDERPRRWSPMWLLAPAAAAAIVVLAIVMPHEELDGVLPKPVPPTVDVEVRLKPDTTTEVRLKPDATTEVRLKPVATVPARPADSAAPALDFETDLTVPLIELAPVTLAATVIDALPEVPPLENRGPGHQAARSRSIAHQGAIMTMRFLLAVLVVALLGAAPSAQQPPPVNPPAPSAQGQPPPVNPPAPGAKPTPAPAEARPPEGPRQPLNVKVDVTIADQRGKGAPSRKMLSIIAADGWRNAIRSQESFFPPMEVPLNVDVIPTILQNNRSENSGKIRLVLNLEYDLPGAPGGTEPKKTATGEWERVTTKSAVRENLTVIVDDGKPLVVSQSADPVSDRQVTVEVRATILK